MFYDNKTTSMLHSSTFVMCSLTIYIVASTKVSKFCPFGVPFFFFKLRHLQRKKTIKIIEYDSHYRNNLFNPSWDLTKGILLMIGEGTHRDCTYLGETQHTMSKDHLYCSSIPVEKAQFIWNASITGINLSIATCLRMEQKCLLFFSLLWGVNYNNIHSV